MTNPVETLWTNVVTPQLADLSMAVLHLLWQQNAAARATEVSKRRYAARFGSRCSAATRRASRHLHATWRHRGDRHAGCGPHGLPALPLRGFRTKRGGRRTTHLFAWIYRNNPATVYILMHNFRPDWTGRIQPCLDGR